MSALDPEALRAENDRLRAALLWTVGEVIQADWDDTEPATEQVVHRAAGLLRQPGEDLHAFVTRALVARAAFGGEPTGDGCGRVEDLWAACEAAARVYGSGEVRPAWLREALGEVAAAWRAVRGGGGADGDGD